MKSHIKGYRIKSGKTQAEVADALGVSPSTYQRWESGAVVPGPETLEILANLFETNVYALGGHLEPFDVTGVMGRSKDRTYFGEVAIHFLSQGKPLLLSISHGTYERACESLQTSSQFLTLMSLDNRTVFVRRDAIADIYFSSDACDEAGPSPELYEQPLGVYPDLAFWELVGNLNGDELIEAMPDGIEPELKLMLNPTQAGVDELVALGDIPSEKVDEAFAKANALNERFADHARCMFWQMGSVLRSQWLQQDCNVYEPLMHLDDPYADPVMEEALPFAIAGYHCRVFINPKALDYLSVPTHLYVAQAREAIVDLEGSIALME